MAFIVVFVRKIFQFNPGFGTEASVPAAPLCRFWYLGSGSCSSITGYRYKLFWGFFAFVSFWYWFGYITIPFRLHFGSTLAPNQVETKALVLESKLFKIPGTKIHELRLFRYSQFQTILQVLLFKDPKAWRSFVELSRFQNLGAIPPVLGWQSMVSVFILHQSSGQFDNRYWYFVFNSKLLWGWILFWD